MKHGGIIAKWNAENIRSSLVLKAHTDELYHFRWFFGGEETENSIFIFTEAVENAQFVKKWKKL